MVVQERLMIEGNLMILSFAPPGKAGHQERIQLTGNSRKNVHCDTERIPLAQ